MKKRLYSQPPLIGKSYIGKVLKDQYGDSLYAPTQKPKKRKWRYLFELMELKDEKTRRK